MRIRDAQHKDVVRLLELGREMHEESIFRKFNYDTAKVSELIATLIDTDAGIALVAEDDDGVAQGGFLGCLYPHWFGNDLQACDYALFLSGEHRSGPTATHLIFKYVRQAKQKGAAQIMLANSTGYEQDRVAKLFELLGFTRRGYVFEYTKHA